MESTTGSTISPAYCRITTLKTCITITTASSNQIHRIRYADCFASNLRPELLDPNAKVGVSLGEALGQHPFRPENA